MLLWKLIYCIISTILYRRWFPMKWIDFWGRIMFGESLSLFQMCFFFWEESTNTDCDITGIYFRCEPFKRKIAIANFIFVEFVLIYASLILDESMNLFNIILSNLPQNCPVSCDYQIAFFFISWFLNKILNLIFN